MASSSTGKSRVVSGRYPPPGSDPIADAIRERRGARGITSLDANLLHAPPIAAGYNALLGAIRAKTNLPGDIREAMILRIAALNGAAYEWIQHVEIGRKESLSTGQLYVIRDTETPFPPLASILTPLQSIAIEFTDHSTKNSGVPFDLIERLKGALKALVLSNTPDLSPEELLEKVESLYVEAAMVVATYNMVSRFLLSTDVAGKADLDVPWPVERKEHLVSLPSYPATSEITHSIHAVTLVTSPAAPWIVFCNSLLTDLTMWSYIVPVLLDLPSSTGATYNILLHSQRGHGRSTLPSSPGIEEDDRLTTIPLLAFDVASLLDALSISTPVQSVIGVSQGGAAALAFATLYGDKTETVIACDTAAATAAGNKGAWEERIRLALGKVDGEDPTIDSSAVEFAAKIGMNRLAKVTVPRWFPSGSLCHPLDGHPRSVWVEKMVTNTGVHGFIHGAKALSEYNTLDLKSAASTVHLFDSKVKNALLLAGELDGGGKVGQGLEALSVRWKEEAALKGSNIGIRFARIGKSGHLPMIDAPEEFCAVITDFFKSL